MPQNPTPTLPPSLGTDAWLYDMIMAGIEPDLTSAAIVHLGEKYRDETPVQHAERLASYEKAFAVFDTVFVKVTGRCESDAHAAHNALRASREKEEQAEHAQETHALEQQFDAGTQS